MAAPQFDTYEAAHAAIAAGASDGHRLVVVAFVDRWAPPAYATAAALDTMRARGEVAAFASIFLIDTTEERCARALIALSHPARL